MTIIDCVSDTHGHYPELEGGDLLIVAGDLTARDTEWQHDDFFVWLNNQPYKKKIFISGNHDNYLQNNNSKFIKTLEKSNLEYLCDSGTEFEGLKIWGSPWTLRFPGMNPHYMAFTVDTEEELAEKWVMIPDDVDILVTHSPPHTILDCIEEIETKWGTRGKYLGSPSLYNLLYKESIRPKLHVYGHIHEGYGHVPKMLDMPYTQFVNASQVNERYEPVNKPIRVIL